MKFLKLAVLVLGLAFTFQAQALTSPIGISLFPPIELPPADFTVTGIRIDLLWGNQSNVYGFDFGTLVNSTLQNSGGVQIAGGLNYNKGSTTVLGLQAAGIANVNLQKTYVLGLQVALYNANLGESTLVGLEAGGINNSPHTKLYGFQVGLYNKAVEVYGFQIGLINSVANLHGLQIGLLNFNDHGLFAIAPILNFGF
jgi:hypothetical protein